MWGVIYTVNFYVSNFDAIIRGLKGERREIISVTQEKKLPSDVLAAIFVCPRPLPRVSTPLQIQICSFFSACPPSSRTFRHVVQFTGLPIACLPIALFSIAIPCSAATFSEIRNSAFNNRVRPIGNDPGEGRNRYHRSRAPRVAHRLFRPLRLRTEREREELFAKFDLPARIGAFGQSFSCTKRDRTST